MTKAVLIPINEAPKVIDLKSDGDISEAVGGFIQGVYPDVPGSILYLNEEGKLTGLAPNQNTEAISELNLGLAPYDGVVGNLVVSGYDEDGETADVPQAILERLNLI